MEFRLIVLIVISVLLPACAPVTPQPTATPAQKLSTIEERLHTLSFNPVIQRAAQYRLSIPSSEPEALGVTVSAANETQQTVRDILSKDVNDDVIVDWLISYGAMGTWTAYNPHTSESVLIPVTEIAFHREHDPDRIAVYRLRDQTHLMIVQSVVVDGTVVGAVGFIFSQAFDNTAFEAPVDQLT